MDKETRDKIFESKYQEIQDVLHTRKKRWTPTYLNYMDFSDVMQIITLHIYKKIHLYDQSKPFINWCNTVISNQMRNLRRDHIGNVSPPCIYPRKCNYSEQDNLCSFTPSGFKCDECPMYKSWLQNKVNGFYIKHAISIDTPTFQEVYSNDIPNTDSEPDYVRAEDRIHTILINKLKDPHRTVYQMFYIDKHREKQIMRVLKISKDEFERIKETLLQAAQEAMEENELFF